MRDDLEGLRVGQDAREPPEGRQMGSARRRRGRSRVSRRDRARLEACSERYREGMLWAAGAQAGTVRISLGRKENQRWGEGSCASTRRTLRRMRAPTLMSPKPSVLTCAEPSWAPESIARIVCMRMKASLSSQRTRGPTAFSKRLFAGLAGRACPERSRMGPLRWVLCLLSASAPHRSASSRRRCSLHSRRRSGRRAGAPAQAGCDAPWSHPWKSVV